MLHLYMSACVADVMKSRSLGRTWKQYNISRLLPGLIYLEKPAPEYSKYFSEQARSDLSAPPLAVQTHLDTNRRWHGKDRAFICSTSAASYNRASPNFVSFSDFLLTQINRRWPTPDTNKTCKNYCYRWYPQSLSSSILPPRTKYPRRTLITCLYPASPFLLSITL